VAAAAEQAGEEAPSFQSFYAKTDGPAAFGELEALSMQASQTGHSLVCWAVDRTMEWGSGSSLVLLGTCSHAS
jgi:hypothetical protein